MSVSVCECMASYKFSGITHVYTYSFFKHYLYICVHVHCMYERMYERMHTYGIHCICVGVSEC